MAAEQQRLSPAERGNLVAYLDGELPENETRAISTKLTQSSTARREMEILEKTWALLDHLPQTKASEHLTERTLTQVQNISEAEDQRAHSALSSLRKLLSVVVAIALCGGFFVAGSVIAQHLIPNPTSRLARDLSIAEHLDEYRAVGSFEFLKQLENSPRFLKETDPTTNSSRP